MNLIIFSRRNGRLRQIDLANPRMLGALALIGMFLIGGAFLAGRQWGVSGAELQPTEQAAKWRRQLKVQQAQVVELRRKLQDNIDALAKRVGLMNAHVVRLDTLGRRLTQMANIDDAEFNFGAPPAQGGPEEHEANDEAGDAQIPELTAMIDKLSKDLQDREVELGVLENLILTRNLNDQIHPKGRPILQGWMSSFFGKRSDPFTGHAAHHKGVDFAGRAGSNVVAVATGVVSWSGERHGFGRLVEITHGNGYVTRYAHNERNLVNVGETVQKGQPVALMGSTGRSTGPHVHFEVLRNGQQVNPLKFIGESR